MKLSFLPADLHLRTEQDGKFSVTLQGTEIFRSSFSKKALAKFNELKKELEAQFPTHELSPEAKAEIMQRSIGESIVKYDSLNRAIKKRAHFRTFG